VADGRWKGGRVQIQAGAARGRGLARRGLGCHQPQASHTTPHDGISLHASLCRAWMLAPDTGECNVAAQAVNEHRMHACVSCCRGCSLHPLKTARSLAGAAVQLGAREQGEADAEQLRPAKPETLLRVASGQMHISSITATCLSFCTPSASFCT
jgi:hypothetical protein